MITNIRAFQEVLKRNNLPTPDTYLGISELIRSLYRPDITPNPERIREVLEELTYPITIPAGNPITFKSCSEVLASEALVTFSPKQSGTGDPSPSNIRPISGWDSLNLWNSGKNLIPKKYYQYNASNLFLGLESLDKENQVYLLAGEYTFKIYTELTTFILNYSPYNGSTVSVSNINTVTLTVKTPNYYRFWVNKSGVTSADITAFQLEEGNQATQYEPYQGETHTATFPETIIGGSYDFVSGKGKSEWGYIAEYDGETINEPWISSIDVYTPGTTPSTGAEVVYKLATPTEITLTPEEIELLKGANTIWTDGDNVTVKFQTLT